MEETLRETQSADNWRDALAQTIDQQRRRVGERIATQRERLRELEARIAVQLDEVTQALTGEQQQAEKSAARADAQGSELARRSGELDRRHAELAEEGQKLAARQQEISRREAELDQLQAGLAGQSAACQERADVLTRQQVELAAAKKAQETDVQRVQAQKDDIHRRESDLKLKEQALAKRQYETLRQRRHIAQQLRARKKELAAELKAQASGSEQGLQSRFSELQGKYDRLREEFDQRQQQRDDAKERLAEMKSQLEMRQNEIRQQQAALEQAQRKQNEWEEERKRLQEETGRRTGEVQGQAVEVARLTAELARVQRESAEQIERLRADQGKSQDAQVQSLHAQLDEGRKKLAAEQAAWEKQRAEHAAELTAARQGGGAAELTKLRDKNKQLEASLAEAERKASSAGPHEGGQELEDLRRRFEMAVRDVRELKTKNAELTEYLAKARQTADTGTGPVSDWESVKRQMLDRLESDFDESDQQGKADKITVQGAIKITDEVVAEKEREIRELRRLLESQAQNVGEMAVGAAAIAQVLDNDELIKQERASLKELQDNLREQHRTAEVDISLERAKLARERAELEEKIRTWEAERANQPRAADPGDKGKKAGARNWLNRLGLGETKAE